MARGQPDYGIYTDTPVASGISDPGEAAARLGSINVYDRRGWTVWMDDFEAPALLWRPSLTAPGLLPVLSTTRAFTGVQSVFLSSPAGANPRSNINRLFPLIRLGKVGIEFWVQGETRAPGYFEVTLNIYDGAIPSYLVLRYDTNASTISLIHAGGTTVIATDVFMLAHSFYFLPIKLVIDMDTDRGVRLLVGEREYDLSAYSAILRPASPWRYVQVLFDVRGRPLGDSWMYLGAFILTQNEP